MEREGFSDSALKKVHSPSGAKSIQGLLPRCCFFCLSPLMHLLRIVRWPELPPSDSSVLTNWLTLHGEPSCYPLALLSHCLGGSNSASAKAWRAKRGNHPQGLQDLRLEFMILFFQLGRTFLDKQLFISLFHLWTEKDNFAESKVFYLLNLSFVNSTWKKNNPYLNRLAPPLNGFPVDFFPIFHLISCIVELFQLASKFQFCRLGEWCHIFFHVQLPAGLLCLGPPQTPQSQCVQRNPSILPSFMGRSSSLNG